eukprot:scaffold2529_cov122-Isochrysis_galbana.AAC.16
MSSCTLCAVSCGLCSCVRARAAGRDLGLAWSSRRADARAAPSASEPNDIVMDIHSSPKRPRDSAQGNMVS